MTDNTEIVDQFAIVEVFGHRRLIGRIQEVEQYGTKMLRIDIPKGGDFEQGFVTQLYGGGSLFSVTPCTLEYLQKLYRHERPAIVAPLDDGGGNEDDDEERPF